MCILREHCRPAYSATSDDPTGGRLAVTQAGSGQATASTYSQSYSLGAVRYYSRSIQDGRPATESVSSGNDASERRSFCLQSSCDPAQQRTSPQRTRLPTEEKLLALLAGFPLLRYSLTPPTGSLRSTCRCLIRHCSFVFRKSSASR